MNTTKLRAVALSNNAGVMLVWVWEELIADCLGFSIHRIDKTTGKRKVLGSRLVRFQGEEKNTDTPADTDHFPVQGMKWLDGGVREGGTYQWEVIAMLGTPGDLKPGPSVLTNEVTVGVDYGPFVKACFNRGHLVSTQWLGDMLPRLEDGTPDPQALIEAIKDPESVIAKTLGASLPAFVKLPFEDAKRIAGHVYALYYELSNPAFVQYLRDNKDWWSMVLGNAGAKDETNAESRKALKEDGADVTDRMMPSSGIAHNKSALLVDADGNPVSWMNQSANPTLTGFYTQANHAIYITSTALARHGLDYYNRTLQDCESSPLQSAEYRKANANVMKPLDLGDGTTVQAIFSPSTEARTKPKTKPRQRTFPLLDQAASTKAVKDALLKAKQGIYFLAFYPGFPSFLDVVTWLQSKKPQLFIRGAVSSVQALPRRAGGHWQPSRFADLGDGSAVSMDLGNTDLSGFPLTGGTAEGGSNLLLPKQNVPLQVMMYSPRKKTPTIIAASALENGWMDWHKELLKLPDAHAIVHSKVIVVDPFGDDPVILGAASDNLGLKAGFQNDETMFVIRGNRALTQAYFVHIMDVYSHFMWRYLVSIGQSTFTGELQSTPDWQDRYLSGRAHDEYSSWVDGSRLLPLKTT